MTSALNTFYASDGKQTGIDVKFDKFLKNKQDKRYQEKEKQIQTKKENEVKEKINLAIQERIIESYNKSKESKESGGNV